MSTHWSHRPISAGNSLSALLDGRATLTFLNRAEDYTLTMPYAHCKGERPPRPPGGQSPGWCPQRDVEGSPWLSDDILAWNGTRGRLSSKMFSPEGPTSCHRLQGRSA